MNIDPKEWDQCVSERLKAAYDATGMSGPLASLAIAALAPQETPK